MKKQEFSNLVDRQLELFEKFPEILQLRLQRALSWLSMDVDERLSQEFDARFIFLWIGFNALYARESRPLPEFPDDAGERNSIQQYFEILVELDKGKQIHGVIQRNDGKIDLLLKNRYIYYRFWYCKLDPSNDQWKNWHGCMRRDQAIFSQKSGNGDKKSVLAVLRIVFSRLYTVRNQLVHGSASKDDELAWEQVNLSAQLMSCFLPVFVRLTMENYDTDWGTPVYPRVCGKPVFPFRQPG